MSCDLALLVPKIILIGNISKELLFETFCVHAIITMIKGE